MKRSELLLSFLLLPLDFVMLMLAGISAYNIRFASIATSIRPANFNIEFNRYLGIISIIALLWLFIFAVGGLYRIRGVKSFSKEFYRIVSACSTGLMLVVILIFVQRELFESRFIVLAAWILAIIYISITRSIVRIVQKILFKYGIGTHKVIIVGSSKTGDVLIHEFSTKPGIGYNVVKRLRDFSFETAQELNQFIKSTQVDEIIQSDPNMNKAEIVRLYDFADLHHITFKYVADLLDAKVLKTELNEISGVPIAEVIRTPLNGWGRIVKRLSDIIGSVLIILILSPIIILTAIIIKLDSYGPVFFSKKDDGTFIYRVGQGGRPFRYFKFRSMKPGMDNMRYTELAEKNIRKDGPMVKIKEDPRITRFGKFIRRWSIDELPELYLVLRGDMSIVGPRPHLPEEVAKYENHHKKVLTIKPGITGLAQISGRSDLSFEDEVKLDTYYIENWSLLMDFSILLKTPLAIVTPREAE
jgi:exopolysaccharide biosynthesis polyprenyl glycosylphosphotransferase